MDKITKKITLVKLYFPGGSPVCTVAPYTHRRYLQGETQTYKILMISRLRFTKAFVGPSLKSSVQNSILTYEDLKNAETSYTKKNKIKEPFRPIKNIYLISDKNAILGAKNWH